VQSVYSGGIASGTTISYGGTEFDEGMASETTVSPGDTNTRNKETMNEATDVKTLTKADLLQFTGTEQWYRHGLVHDVLFTDGAKYVAERAGAYWLLDEIALTQRGNKTVAGEEFQVWKLTVNPDHTATLICGDGNDNAVYQKAIKYTDFPLSEIALYFTNNTILLPSEY
jgi:hypothetical protein